MNAKITATAHNAPEKVMTNFDLEKLVDTSDEWIRSRTGIVQRHIVAKDEASSDISTRIANSLLEKSQMSPDDLDLILVGTVTPDHFTPSTAALVQKNIKANNAWGYDLSAACSGFLFGLIVDLSISGIFFGLSPLIYTITGYLGGGLNINSTRLNPFYTSLTWIVILFFHFFVYCLIQYQDLWEFNRKIFWGKWFGTAIYTISFAGVLQFVYPIKSILNAKSR